MNNKIKLLLSFCASFLLLFFTTLPVYAAGTISLAVSSGTVKAGETVTVTVYAANAANEAVVADMSITYDTSLLEFISSSDTDAAYGNGTVKVKGEDVSVKFKAISSGDAYVKAEGATLTAAGTHITVTGGSSDTPLDTDTDVDAAKSGDNSLSSLSISPGSLSPAFKGSVTEYTAQVGGDVSEITVTPVTSNSKAAVESITGNKDLQTGKNVITIMVKAENGTKAAYKITVTKGEGAPSDTSPNEKAPSEDSADKPEDTEETGETAPVSAGADAIVIDGVSYKISDEFKDEDIPEGFSKADFEYKGAPHKGISFDHGHLGMYYLVNDANESSFFVYDADRDKFYPYVRLTSGEHYIILMVVPNGVVPPERYEEANLEIGGWSAVSAFQYSGPSDKEIVKFDNPEEEAAYSAGSDFYIFYGMDDTGTPGWYQYDVRQETYQRFNAEAIAPADNGKDYDMLLKSYNELDDRYDKVRTKDRRLIGGMIFGLVVLLIVVINLLLKIRELGMDDDPYREEPPERKRKKARKKRKTAAKPSVPKRVSRITDYDEEDAEFYDGDDREIIDEFEEEPNLLSRKPKRDKSARIRKTEPERNYNPLSVGHEEDDDIEFLDLNE